MVSARLPGSGGGLEDAALLLTVGSEIVSALFRSGSLSLLKSLRIPLRFGLRVDFKKGGEGGGFTDELEEATVRLSFWAWVGPLSERTEEGAATLGSDVNAC